MNVEQLKAMGLTDAQIEKIMAMGGSASQAQQVEEEDALSKALSTLHEGFEAEHAEGTEALLGELEANGQALDVISAYADDMSKSMTVQNDALRKSLELAVEAIQGLREKIEEQADELADMRGMLEDMTVGQGELAKSMGAEIAPRRSIASAEELAQLDLLPTPGEQTEQINKSMQDERAAAQLTRRGVLQKSLTAFNELKNAGQTRSARAEDLREAIAQLESGGNFVEIHNQLFPKEG